MREQKVQRVLDYYTKGTCPLSAHSFLFVADLYGMGVEVMLTQGVIESRLGTRGRRPLSTHNIWNVGNVDSGANHQMGTWLEGAKKYASLMSRLYGRTAQELLERGFRRIDNPKLKYATDPLYCIKFRMVLKKVRALMEEVRDE